MQYTRGEMIKNNTFTLTGGVDTYIPSTYKGLIQMNLIADQDFMIGVEFLNW